MCFVEGLSLDEYLAPEADQLRQIEDKIEEQTRANGPCGGWKTDVYNNPTKFFQSQRECLPTSPKYLFCFCPKPLSITQDELRFKCRDSEIARFTRGDLPAAVSKLHLITVNSLLLYMDLQKVNSQIALVGSQLMKPEESQASRHSTSSPDFGIEGPRRASPTNFNTLTEGDGNPAPGSSRGIESRHNSILSPLPATRGNGDAARHSEIPRTLDTVPAQSPTRRSNIDWIVPLEPERKPRAKTVGERLLPTLENAEAERTNYALRAKMTGFALNVAIGLQVLLGALTTAISATTSGKQTSIAVSILGGLSTLVASYLARARGSNEPELSIIRVKDLDQFIRECKAFDMDFGHLTGDAYDERLQKFRTRFEELLGNANGERRLANV